MCSSEVIWGCPDREHLLRVLEQKLPLETNLSPGVLAAFRASRLPEENPLKDVFRKGDPFTKNFNSFRGWCCSIVSKASAWDSGIS